MPVKLGSTPSLQVPKSSMRPAFVLAAFIPVMVSRALYIHHTAAASVDGFADDGISYPGFLGLGPYFAAQDYFLGFSYALGAVFAMWAGGTIPPPAPRDPCCRCGGEYRAGRSDYGIGLLPAGLLRVAYARRLLDTV